MSSIWNSIKDGFESLLGVLHDLIEPIFGVHAWGWAIVLLTVVVRLALFPLAVKQIRSMRAMQELAPKIKKIQKKYPTDREMMREDPEKYRARKAKVNEETMALYREAGVNPAGGCLPLIAQMPIFFALFSVLRDSEEIRDQPFYFFTDGLVAGAENLAIGLGRNAGEAGLPAYLLIAAMAATMFISQRQTMSRTTVEGPAAQQQKIMLYVMPAMLAFFGTQLPLGVLLYWVTTNTWQMGQQYFMYRNQEPSAPAHGARGGSGSKGDGPTGGSPAGGAPKKGAGASKDRSDGAKNGAKKSAKARTTSPTGVTKNAVSTKNGGGATSHVPRRAKRDKR